MTEPSDPRPKMEPSNRPMSRILSVKGWVWFCFLLVGAVAVMAAGMAWFTRYFETSQQKRPRYAAERAIRALERGDKDEARREVAILETERPIYVSGFFNIQLSETYEGPVLRNRVTQYTELATRLMAAQMWPEAMTVAWKALFEFHITGRTLQWLPPWECLYYSAFAMQPSKNETYVPLAMVPQIAMIIGAHGAERVRMPGQMEPYPFSGETGQYARIAENFRAPLRATGKDPGVTPLTRALKQGYESDSTMTLMNAADDLLRLANEEKNPILRNPLIEKAHAWMVKAGQRPRARQLLREKWGNDPAIMDVYWNTAGRHGIGFNLRDPTLIGMFWNDRPGTSTVNAAQFLDSFGSDARVTVLGFNSIEPIENGYFGNSLKNMVMNGAIPVFLSNSATRFKFTTQAPVRRITFAYNSSVALGVAPILLVRTSAKEFMPLYLDAPVMVGRQPPVIEKQGAIQSQGLVSFDCHLTAGEHTVELWFLNDGAFSWPLKRINEDRNFDLYRMALVHVAAD